MLGLSGPPDVQPNITFPWKKIWHREFWVIAPIKMVWIMEMVVLWRWQWWGLWMPTVTVPLLKEDFATGKWKWKWTNLHSNSLCAIISELRTKILLEESWNLLLKFIKFLGWEGMPLDVSPQKAKDRLLCKDNWMSHTIQSEILEMLARHKVRDPLWNSTQRGSLSTHSRWTDRH